MKINTPSKPVESGGIKQEGEFRIKNSAKAFSILSSGLYSNKHQAILRELGCNAYDSHVEAGKAEVPFTVHLPSKLNPEFIVRDYGIGLDHEGVVNIYTTYFESTKQDSNDYVGCMGLGSKSPFSYTDNFSITAIKDGTKRLYSAFINEQGVPTIALLHEEDTDDGNGVEVKFAVNDRNDMHRFRTEAANVYKWFKVKPEITGQEVDIPEITYAEKDIIPGVHVRDNNRGYGYNQDRSWAVMGNVAYPIKLEDQDSSDDDGKRRNAIRKMYEQGGLVVEFGIGDLDVAASREELSYIPHTMESLYRRGEEIIAHLGTYIDKELSGAKTKWERMEVLNRLHKSNKDLFTPAINAYIENNSRKFFKYTRFNLYGLKTYFALQDFDAISKDLQVSFYKVEKRYADSNMIAHRERTTQVEAGTKSNPKHIAAWQIDADTSVVIQDDKGGLLPRIKEGVSEGNIKNRQVLAFRITNKDADKDAIYKKVRRLLGNPTVIKSSTLPKTSNAHTSKKSLSAYKFAIKRGGYNRDGYKLELITDSSLFEHGYGKKYVYYPLNHKSAIVGNTTLDPSAFHDFLERHHIFDFLGIRESHVYGVNKTTLKLIEKDKEWVNIFDLFQAEFAKIDWAAAKKEALRKHIQTLVNQSEYDFTKLNKQKLGGLLNSKSPMGKLATFFADNKDTSSKDKTEYDWLIRGATRLIPSGVTREAERKKMDKLLKGLKIDEADTEIDALLDEVKETYPMLEHVDLNGWRSDRHWDDAYDYILLVDSTL